MRAGSSETPRLNDDGLPRGESEEELLERHAQHLPAVILDAVDLEPAVAEDILEGHSGREGRREPRPRDRDLVAGQFKVDQPTHAFATDGELLAALHEQELLALLAILAQGVARLDVLFRVQAHLGEHPVRRALMPCGSTPMHGVGHGGLRDLNVRGLPLSKPPYGRLSAIDLDRGEIIWQTPHGETPDRVRLHPALAGLDIPRTGELCAGLVGPLVTKTLVIMGECSYHATAAGPRGAMLRAYDKATGVEVGAVYMPAPQSGSPMTYLVGGRQYVVVAISGGAYSGEYVAFALPPSA